MHDTDDDLPWDPLWAYVLGDKEGQDDVKKGVFRQQKKSAPKGEGIMSYIKDVLPTAESRDDAVPRERSNNKDTKEGSKKNGFAWRRNDNVVETEADDAWEWRISVGNSYDDEMTPAINPTTTSTMTKTSAPSKEKRSSLFRRHDMSTNERRALEAKPTESWEWGLHTGSERDDIVSSILPPIMESSQAKQPRSTKFASPFRKKADRDSWDWQLSNDKKEKRSFGRRLSGEKEVDTWDFLTTTGQEKGSRRVRFARSSGSRESKEWIDTQEMVAQLERSQSSLFDWVGINPSYDEEESAEKVGRRLSQEKKDTVSDTGDLFGGLFSWEGSSNEDEASFQSSTDESSAETMEEEMGSDDDSRSEPTIVSDASQSREVTDEGRSLGNNNEINEVRLSFQPVPHGEMNTLQVPSKVNDGTVSNDSSSVLARDSKIIDLRTVPDAPPANAIDNKPDCDNEKPDCDGIGWGSIEQPRSLGRGMCCSVKSMSSEQLQWSAESGIPFHELSREEQSRFFPKSRAISDQVCNVSNDPELSVNHPILPMASPLSLFEYEYNTGINMYLSYENFGDDSLVVISAPTPEIKRSNKNKSQKEMLVMVEASTVSLTDCAIRQGHWWGSTKSPLPNTPGIDVVGRVYRVDAETNANFGWNVGDRIISLVKWGGNARYLSLNPSHAVAAPEELDPASAVCLVETYLAAFQSLHMGQTNQQRYREDSLVGKRILLRGLSVSSMGHAIAQLAANAGVLDVYAVAKLKHFNYLSSLGITPLNNDGKDWLKTMVGTIDLIISCDDDVVSIPYKLLKGSGNMITLKFGGSKFVKTSMMKKVRGRLSKIPRNRMLSYDLYEQWDKNLDSCKVDLQHLLQLLQDKKIEPTVLDRISLNKVADAQGLVSSKRLSGYVVCEPWLMGKSRTICL